MLNSTRPRLLCVAAVLGGAGVALGAFGAHALREVLSDADMAVFVTASRYHLMHALLATIIAMAAPPGRAYTVAVLSLLAGVVLFSGSLYLLVTLQLRWLGVLTPVGGLCLLGGWCLLAIAAWRDRRGGTGGP